MNARVRITDYDRRIMRIIAEHDGATISDIEAAVRLALPHSRDVRDGIKRSVRKLYNLLVLDREDCKERTHKRGHPPKYKYRLSERMFPRARAIRRDLDLLVNHAVWGTVKAMRGRPPWSEAEKSRIEAFMRELNVTVVPKVRAHLTMQSGPAFLSEITTTRPEPEPARGDAVARPARARP